MASKFYLSSLPLPLLTFLLLLLLFLHRSSAVTTATTPSCKANPASDVDLVQFAMNLEFLEAEFFLFGAFGKGLDSYDTYLASGGPAPVGGKKAQLDPLVQSVVEELGYQEIGHLRAIYQTVGGIERPLIDISSETFEEIFDKALGKKLVPPFDPYRSSIHYLLASYLIPYVGLTGYVGINPHLHNYTTKALVAGLLGVESGQDAIIRTILYQYASEKLYGVTVGELTDKLSMVRDELGKCGLKDKGVIVPKELGAEGKIHTNVLSANEDSLSFARTPQEIARIVYGSGSDHVPGGFFPHGGNGKIARSFL